jgi:putative glutamine amidotransferase
MIRTLGVSKMGLNPPYFYHAMFNGELGLDDEIKVEIVDFNHEYDWIIFDGGADVTPSYYGENKHPTTDCHPERDIYEKEIFYHYKYDDTMFMGICRGSQFLNVMCGGTLYQNLADYKLQHYFFHEIELNTGVYDTMEGFLPPKFVTNSTHHQAVKKLGDTLGVIAWETKTRIVEAFAGLDFKIRAVQFHPEFIGDFAYTRDILKWLLRYC